MAERQVQDKTLIIPQLNPSRIPPVIALSPFVPSQASTVPGKRTRGDTTTGSGPRGGVRLLDGHRAACRVRYWYWIRLAISRWEEGDSSMQRAIRQRWSDVWS
jgi:hypothetical protein